jgi:dynactin complex subunit
VATVRYCGPIGKKFGTWVALELDEPTGDCNGLENNGEKVFECEENFGLILRNT